MNLSKFDERTINEYFLAKKLQSVFLFDLDGTLTRKELLPWIGQLIGISAQLKFMTKKIMQDGGNFKNSFAERVELLSKIPVDDVQLKVKSVPVLEQLINWIKQRNDSCIVITGNLDIWVGPLIEEIGIAYFSSIGSNDSKRTNIDFIIEKNLVMTYLPDIRTIAIGDGSNDVGLLSAASVGILTEIVNRAPFALWEVADFAVREENSLCRMLSRL